MDLIRTFSLQYGISAIPHVLHVPASGAPFSFQFSSMESLMEPDALAAWLTKAGHEVPELVISVPKMLIAFFKVHLPKPLWKRPEVLAAVAVILLSLALWKIKLIFATLYKPMFWYFGFLVRFAQQSIQRLIRICSRLHTWFQCQE
jgi:hypothetical protein